MRKNLTARAKRASKLRHRAPLRPSRQVTQSWERLAEMSPAGETYLPGAALAYGPPILSRQRARLARRDRAELKVRRKRGGIISLQREEAPVAEAPKGFDGVTVWNPQRTNPNWMERLR